MINRIPTRLTAFPLLSVHTAALLFGTAGVLGAGVGLNALEVTFGRTVFAAIALAAIWLLVKWSANRRVGDYGNQGSVASRTTLATIQIKGLLILSGMILAFHWVTFFASIQYSTVAVGLVTFSTCPVFVALLEPVFFKDRLQASAIFAAIMVLLGVIIISGIHTGALVYGTGIMLGVVSGFSFAVLQLLNRKLANSNGALTTSLVQNAVATLVLLPMVFSSLRDIDVRQWVLLMFLGVGCTAFAHTLFINALKRVTVSTASLIAAGLEPVYGVVLAAIFLQQRPALYVLVGGTIIVATVLFMTRHQKEEKRL